MIALGLILAAAVARASVGEEAVSVRIDHQALECVGANAFPRVTARLSPAEEVALAWVHFRSAQDGGWYSVRLRADEQGFSAILPRPRWLERFDYYIEVTSREAEDTRGPELSTEVVKDARTCGTRHGDSVDSAQGLVVEKPVGAASKSPPVPRGFSGRGIVGGDAGMFELPPGRTVLLTAGLVGGAVLGIQSQLKGSTPAGPPAPPPFDLRFLASSPPPGDDVSLSGSMAMRIGLAASSPGNQPVRFVRVDFLVALALCASLFGPVEGDLPQEVQVEGRFERSNTRLRTCQPPFETNAVEATVLGEAYAPLANAPRTTLGVNYRMIP